MTPPVIVAILNLVSPVYTAQLIGRNEQPQAPGLHLPEDSHHKSPQPRLGYFS